MQNISSDEKDEKDVLEDMIEDLMDEHGTIFFYDDLNVDQLRKYIQYIIKVYNRYNSGLPLTFEKTTFKNGTNGKTISTKNRLINEFISENPEYIVDKNWYKYKVSTLRKFLYMKNKQNKAHVIIKKILDDMKLNPPVYPIRRGAGTDLMYQSIDEESIIETISNKFNIDIPYSNCDEQRYLAKRLTDEVFNVLNNDFFKCQGMCWRFYNDILKCSS